MNDGDAMRKCIECTLSSSQSKTNITTQSQNGNNTDTLTSSSDVKLCEQLWIYFLVRKIKCF